GRAVGGSRKAMGKCSPSLATVGRHPRRGWIMLEGQSIEQVATGNLPSPEAEGSSDSGAMRTEPAVESDRGSETSESATASMDAPVSESPAPDAGADAASTGAETPETATPAMSDPAFAELLSATLARTQPIAVGDRLRA